MERRPVNLRIAGQSYRVVSSATEEELQRLASAVSAKVEQVTPRGGRGSPQAVVLAAIALAHDLEEERARRLDLEDRTRELLSRVLGRIDEALGCAPP